MNNLFIGIGRLVENAQLLSSSSGRPYIRFRMELERDPRLPRKVPRNDYQTVVAYGERFVPLVEHLVRGQHVVVIGWVQSRDLPDGRVVNEIGAETVTLVAPPDFVEKVAQVIRKAGDAGVDIQSILGDNGLFHTGDTRNDGD